MPEPLLTNYLSQLLAGRRAECFGLIAEALQRGASAQALVHDVVWPAMTQIDRLYREDQINAAVENMAARINRTVADQLQTHLPRKPPNGRRLVVACGESPREEIGSQITADLFQSEGWEVYLVGAGVPHDEILTLTGQLRPDLLLIYGVSPQEVPGVRALVESIREIGVCPTMNVVVSGGVFNRADGLWQEVGADRFAASGAEAVALAATLPPRAPGAPRRTGIVKKRHRRRKARPAPAGTHASAHARHFAASAH